MRLRHACCAILALAMISGAAPAADRPNILVILTDDMGFSDLGCFGGEIETPQLDSLAASGLRFTEFYNTARCWPTRATLMSGRYSALDSLIKVIGSFSMPLVQIPGCRVEKDSCTETMYSAIRPATSLV